MVLTWLRYLQAELLAWFESTFVLFYWSRLHPTTFFFQIFFTCIIHEREREALPTLHIPCVLKKNKTCAPSNLGGIHRHFIGKTCIFLDEINKQKRTEKGGKVWSFLSGHCGACGELVSMLAWPGGKWHMHMYFRIEFQPAPTLKVWSGHAVGVCRLAYCSRFTFGTSVSTSSNTHFLHLWNMVCISPHPHCAS